MARVDDAGATGGARSRSWLRAGLVLLAVPQVATGAWAVLDARGWYDGFPGAGWHWVAVDGPFNHHLAGDAGAGFLATGLAVALAALWLDRRPVQMALVAYLAFAVPHLVYHAAHPVDALGAAEEAGAAASLVAAVVLAAALLVLSTRAHDPADDAAGGRGT